MLKLSFILPCYNVERYIADCLNSIYAQGLPEDEFEVICVNDCSMDGTRSIIAEYASRHPNLTLIDHSENLTAGGARNTGIKVARGEYIWFVDPDDMIMPNSAIEVFDVAKGKGVDVLMFNFEIVNENKESVESVSCFVDSEVMSGQEYVLTYTPNHFSEHCMVWRCLFRTRFLQERQLWFPIMRKAQDVSFLWKVILVAERVASVNGIYYCYRSNPYSVANKTRDAHVAFSERVLFANEIAKLLEDQDLKIVSLIGQDMEKTLRWCANSNLELISQMADDGRSKYFDEIVRNKSAVSRVRPYMNRKQKRIFSTFGGKSFWLYKIRLVEKLNRYGKVEH